MPMVMALQLRVGPCGLGWRCPHIKGPADAPLMMGEKVYMVEAVLVTPARYSRAVARLSWPSSDSWPTHVAASRFAAA
ncbi:UNVERIFIED_CONTAM: hypothetical protein RKD50_000055 [Streptomyces canus]